MMMRILVILILSMSLGLTTPASSHAQTPGETEQSAIEGVGSIKDGVRYVTPTEAASLIDNDSTIMVLDVRTRGEYNRGHIEGAVQINYFSLGFKKKLSTLDKNVTWIVHCKSGHRSGRTVPLMKKADFASIIHMDGGFDGWKKADFPISISEN